jgi:two-component system cell cycle sensor histidine kinase/response regulator CckA
MLNMAKVENVKGFKIIQFSALGLVILTGLFLVSRYNFLLFHVLAEFFSIAVIGSLFLLVWNTRRIARNDGMLFLGITFLFMSMIDIVHTLSYRGMGVFPGLLGANYTTQLWIAARGLEAISLFLFPLYLNRRIRTWLVFGVYGAITALIMAAIFSWQIFPDCYIEGVGLTVFKKVAEYIIYLIMAVAMVLLFRFRNQLDRVVFQLMIGALALAIAAELFFTIYINVFGLSNVAGHFLKILSYFLIYLALVRSSLTKPYSTLFQNLVKEKTALEESEETTKKKIQAILSPEGDINTLNLGDIIDREAIQSLLEDFYKLTNVLSAVLDHSGNILVAVGWQDICTKFHRCHPEASKNCLESDTILTSGIPWGKFKAYRCKNNMWDMATPIEVSGRHIGNIFIGQFFYDDETIDYDLFRRQARQYGFDETEYIAALDRVPRLSRETINTAMAFFTKLSSMISSLSYSNISLARMNSQQETTLSRLEERDQYISSILETTQEGFWVLDSQGKVVDVNEAYCHMSGYTREELLQLHIMDLDADENPVETASRMKRIIENGSERFETRHRRKEGSILYVEISASWLGGNVQRFICFCHDITERKLAEETLKKSEEKFRSYVDFAPLGVFVTDKKGNYVEVNPAASKITGYSKEELLSMNLLELVAPDSLEPAADHFKKVVEQGFASGEISFIKKDGSINYWTTDAVKLSNDRFLGFVLDITERKLAEEALKESEDRLRKAQEVGKIGNWEYDILTGNIWGSEEAFRIYGFDRKTPFLSLEEVEERAISAEKNRKSLIDLITNNVAYNIEFELRPANREELIIVHSIAELVRDERGNPVKVTGVVQDITESKTKEKEQLKLRSQLQQAQKMESVGRLAGGVAHDFNNMLGVILGHTDMLLEETNPDQPIHANLDEIRKAAERSANLTRQLLAFARRQTVSPKVLDLNQAVEGMLNMLRRLIGEDIDLTWLPGKDQMMVNIDPSQIDQMLANLCVNARDAITDNGKITIETDNVSFNEDYCSTHAGSIPGEFIMLAVSDDGVGMDKETLSNVFEPFFTTKEQGKGTGLGLATIYGIVKQNKGFINGYSEQGLGTTFKIYLPRHRGKTSQILDTNGEEPDIRGHETILLVEDEHTILTMTTMMLERLGYTVLATSSPGEAITLVGEYTDPIHLLLTDVIMPEMNGRDLAKNILTLYPNINRLFMSGYTADVIAHHGVLTKGVNFIQKPFSINDLSAKVREALDSEPQ